MEHLIFRYRLTVSCINKLQVFLYKIRHDDCQYLIYLKKIKSFEIIYLKTPYIYIYIYIYIYDMTTTSLQKKAIFLMFVVTQACIKWSVQFSKFQMLYNCHKSLFSKLINFSSSIPCLQCVCVYIYIYIYINTHTWCLYIYILLCSG